MSHAVLALIAQALQGGRRVCVATVIESTRQEVAPGGNLVFIEGRERAMAASSLGNPELDRAVGRKAQEMMARAGRRPAGRAMPSRERMAHMFWPESPCRPEMRLFLELLEPPAAAPCRGGAGCTAPLPHRGRGRF